MLIITIDIVPGGHESYCRNFGSMRIANLSNFGDTCDYAVEVMEAANPLTGDPPWNGKCIVLAHDRRQSVWALIARACEETLEAHFVDL